MKSPARQIQKLLDEAHELGVQYIEAEARRILRASPKYEEFVMAMGMPSLTVRGARFDSIDIEDCPNGKRLAKFIRDYDSLAFTGTPMRFTKDGPKITDW